MINTCCFHCDMKFFFIFTELIHQPFSRTDIYVISVIQFRDYKLYLSQQSDFITARQYFGDDKYKELCNSIISDLESLCEWFADRICD